MDHSPLSGAAARLRALKPIYHFHNDTALRWISKYLYLHQAAFWNRQVFFACVPLLTIWHLSRNGSFILYEAFILKMWKKEPDKSLHRLLMQMSEASIIAINISQGLKLGIYAKKAHCQQSWSVSIFQTCNLKTTSNLSPPCKRYKFS